MFNQPSESWFVATHNAFIDSIGQQEPCRPARRHGRRPSSTGHNRCGAVDFSVVPTWDTEDWCGGPRERRKADIGARKRCGV